MGLNVLINGPFVVGIPVVVRTRFPEGGLPKLPEKRIGMVSLSVISRMVIELAMIGLSPSMSSDPRVALGMGTPTVMPISCCSPGCYKGLHPK